MEPNHPAPAFVITCDVGRITQPDLRTIDALARLELLARRLDATVRIEHACEPLVDLIVFAGLDDVLVIVRSGVEADRQIEEREVLRPDEEVHGGDGAA